MPNQNAFGIEIKVSFNDLNGGLNTMICSSWQEAYSVMESVNIGAVVTGGPLPELLSCTYTIAGDPVTYNLFG